MAVTILEAAKQTQDPLLQSVVETYARTSDILRVLPFQEITGAAIEALREDTLPGIGFRGVNEGYTESSGDLQKIKESLKIMGGDVDVDRFIVKTMGERQRAIQVQMKLKAASLKWTQSFIKGDESADPAAFNGIQKRLGDAATDQVIHAGATSGGDALSLSKLDELIDAVEMPIALLMNKTMRRRLTAAARNSSVASQINYTQDEFGRTLTTYNDLPILIADKDNENNDIMPFTEANPGGGTAASTSIYCMNIGEGYLTGIQNGGIDVEDLGQLKTAPVYRTRNEWYNNFVIWHPRAVARLSGIKNAAVTA